MIATARRKRNLIYLALAGLLGIAYWQYPETTTKIADRAGYAIAAVFILLLIGGIALALTLGKKETKSHSPTPASHSVPATPSTSRGGSRRGGGAVLTLALVAVVLAVLIWGFPDWSDSVSERPQQALAADYAAPQPLPIAESGRMPSKESGEYSPPFEQEPGYDNCIDVPFEGFRRRVSGGQERYQSTGEARDFTVYWYPDGKCAQH
ncbi:MAG TPA: hypothetical protein VJA87_03350 [Candidatus Paceibacterota bacterium]